MIAVLVILGSLARIPIGVLTNRYSGRQVMTALLAFLIIPLLGMTLANSLGASIFWAFLLGMAGSSFALGYVLLAVATAGCLALLFIVFEDVKVRVRKSARV
jgi:NNP family nitrate/nitrite transporter-like MFS transporter